MRFSSRLSRVSRENGSMYHIYPPQCQTQFGLAKKVYRPGLGPAEGRSHGANLARTCGPRHRPHRRREDGQRLAGFDRGLDLAGAERDGPGLARETQRAQRRRCANRPIDQLRRDRRRTETSLFSARAKSFFSLPALAIMPGA